MKILFIVAISLLLWGAILHLILPNGCILCATLALTTAALLVWKGVPK